MSSYVVLARKWRPSQFSDIVGQGHIVRTLNNAIRSERIHQAYLFTGSRGIGKTSIARIFAKVIRCPQRHEKNQILYSCDSCSDCKEITASNSVDVIEIDGASNNGVEAVREIRENAKYMPSSGTRKIYIIDEVHMLTTAAFNALLKILEEPPVHVIFIFATTEPHKIPSTILSRCQRFDYRRVTLSQIQTRLQEVITAEKIQADSDAIALIARAAEGSMRDALSLLDQVIAFSEKKVTLASVQESIGLITGKTLIGILEGVFKREPLKSLQFVDEAYQQGFDLRVLTRSLIEFIHAVLLAKVGCTHSAGIELSESEWSELVSISETRTIEEIELIFQVLHSGLDWIARSPQPKIVLDILLIKCATAETLIYVDSISQSSPQNSETPYPKPNLDSKIEKTSSTHHTLSPPVFPSPQPPSEPISVKSEKNEDQAPALQDEKSWLGFIEYVRQTRPFLATMLEHSSETVLPLGKSLSSGELLNIYFPTQEVYYRDQLQSRVYQEQLSHLSKEYFGVLLRFQIELKDAGESLAARKDREQKRKIEALKEKVQNHPIIREAKSLFGGELGPIDVKVDPYA